MDSSSTVPRIGFASFLDSGEFSDFTIVCKQYKLKAHKLVLCAESHYFRKLCGGPFKVCQASFAVWQEDRLTLIKEAAENVVNLGDQQPLMIARLLQYLYTGEYDVINFTPGLSRILDNASSPISFDDAILAQDYDFEVHAQVYAMAGRFEVPALQAMSAASFIFELRSKNFSIADLVSAIDIVYTTTPEYDFGLRKWVVYRAQQIQHELVRHDDFQTAMKAHPDFAWDFATKYARANYLWCSHCNDTIDLVECRCGFYGMCGDPLCSTQATAALRCTRCENYGKLGQEVPLLEVNIKLEELGRTDEPEAPLKKTPKKRKRFA